MATYEAATDEGLWWGLSPDGDKLAVFSARSPRNEWLTAQGVQPVMGRPEDDEDRVLQEFLKASEQYSLGGSRVWIVSFDGSEPVALDGVEYQAVASFDGLSRPIQWSPDGRYIAYSLKWFDSSYLDAEGRLTYDRLVVVEAATGKLVRWWDGEMLGGSASWSEDSSQLLTLSIVIYPKWLGPVYRVRDIATGTSRPVEFDPDVSRVWDRGREIEAVGMIGNDHVMLRTQIGKSAYISSHELATAERRMLVHLTGIESIELHPFAYPTPPEYWLND
ncbi:MAG: hypothetical protein LBJ08_02310 [Bifidobacteriaceae bacterium]|jgi:hypothetical protein|nr:hypothetical protein [Bifidobacteriaceae bacterium]